MEHAYWHAKWVAHETNFDQREPNIFLKEYFKKFSLKPGQKILVPLAGKSVDMLWLKEQGLFVVGVELSEQACVRFFGEFGLPYTEHRVPGFVIFETEGLQLFCGDFFLFTAEMAGVFDAMYDRAALIALPAAMRERYAQHIMNLCAPTTQIFLHSAVYDQTEMKGPPFSVDDAEILHLFAPRFKFEKLHDEPAREIPTHLSAKGLTAWRDLIYRLY